MRNLSVVLVLALSVAARSVSAQTAPAVPTQYQGLYTYLQGQIDSFTRTMQSGWNGTRAPVTYSAQLRTASSEQGDLLIAPGHMANVQQEIQGFQALGITSVTIHVNFPFLYAPFHGTSTDLQQYRAFYGSVAAEVRARGMKLVVETQVAKSVTSDAPGTYVHSLSWADYQTGRGQTAVACAQILRPDYMSVILEPDTEAAVSGQRLAGTVPGSLQLLGSILGALRTAGFTSIPVGAGVGTWMPAFHLFLQAYAATPVQFLDIHVYQVNRNFLQNALTAADIAHQAGKQIAMTEAWLVKQGDNEPTADIAQIYARDPNSYWAPLDAQFLRAMVALANYKQFAFISPFWTSYFFAYVDGQTSSSIQTDALKAATQAMNAGQFSSTGRNFESMILPSPDTSAPQVPAPPAISASARSMQLTWRSTSDNVGVAGYQVYRNGALVGSTSSLTYTDNGLQGGTVYSYALRAFDAAGNVSSLSAAAQAPRIR